MKFNLAINNINYVKILYIDESNTSHCTKAYINSISETDICACIKKENLDKIKTPQNISVGFACDNGLYKANTILNTVKFHEPYHYFYFDIPKNIDFQQNREYFRVNLEKDVVITYKDSENFVKSISAKIHDISANGIGIKLDAIIKFSDEVLISIYFPNYEINTKAKFVRTDTDENFVKSSFNFLNLSKKDTDFISKICIKKQLEDKRNTLK